MKERVHRTGRGLVALLVAAAFAFGGFQALEGVDLFSGASASECTWPDQIGTCPPYHDESCEEDCFQYTQNLGGWCDPITGCCTCVM